MESTTFLRGRVSLHLGDVRAQLDAMTPESVDCVVTSPPYWGLRDYGVAGQIGLEPSLGEHLDVMVDVFDRVRRVLKPEGTLWLNYGDCYATAPNGRSAAATKAAGADDRTFRDKPFSTVGPIYKPDYEKTPRDGLSANGGNVAAAHGGRIVAGGALKPGDLCMIPNRLAIALQDAGWWVRSEIVWGKPNAMPDSSGVARPATAHEKVFLLAKSDRARLWRARDTGEMSSCPDLTEQVAMVTTGAPGPRWIRMRHFYDAAEVRMPSASASLSRWAQDVEAQEGSYRANGGAITNGTMKAVGGRRRDKARGLTPRHEGQINHTGLDEAPRGGGRLLRNYEPAPLAAWDISVSGFSGAHFATFPPELAARCIRAGCPKGGLVLDPFGGAGTTALVALRLGRRAALIELNPDYAALARARIERDWREAPPAAKPRAETAAPLFDMLNGGPV